MTNQDTTSIDVSQNDNSDTPKQSCITNDTSIDEQIREMLFNWHKWRDYYYSDLQEQVITDDEWKVTRDKIDYDAIEKIKALISDQVAKARIDIEEKLPKRLEGTENWTFETPDLSPANQRELGYNQAIDDMLATLNGVKNK